MYEIGTNNMRRGITWETWAAETREFHEAADLGDDLFAVVLLGPMDDRRPDQLDAWNARTVELAAEEGWAVLDPWDGLDDGSGRWSEGMGRDPVHPSEDGARILAENIAQGVRDALGSR